MAKWIEENAGTPISWVVGFMYDGDPAYKVLLIEKTKPAWQAGKLNGVGGKIEEGETPHEAMAREFEEETGIQTAPDEWQLRLVFENPRNGNVLHVFEMYGPIQDARQTTEEMPIIASLDELHQLYTVPNLQWILPMLTRTRVVGQLCGEDF